MPVTGGVPVVGEPEPFSQFFAREYRMAIRLAYVLSGSRHFSEDLAQEAFLAAFRDWDRIGRYEDPAGWVRHVVANRAVSAFRRRLSEVRALGRLGGRAPEVGPELSDAGAEVWREVRRLPRRQAQVVALRYLEDLPDRQIAGLLGCSEGAVKSYLHRARQTLAVRLRGMEGGG